MRRQRIGRGGLDWLMGSILDGCFGLNWVLGQSVTLATGSIFCFLMDLGLLC